MSVISSSRRKLRRLFSLAISGKSVTLFLLSCLVFLNNQLSHYLNNGGNRQPSNVIYWTLSQEQNKNIISHKNRIFFHETSGQMQLSFRQCCVVESAALHNPQRPVQIFFQPQQSTSPSIIDSSSAWFQILSQYPNIRIIVIDNEQLYFKDSPLEDWYGKGQWRNSKWRVQHMADYIRMVTLSKFGGGMYIDLDIITLKPYDGNLFRNFVTVKNKQLFRITNAVFHLQSGHRLIDAIIQEQKDEYDADDYVYNGPGAMSSAMTKRCNFTRGHLESNICNDVQLLPHYFFHPIGGQSGHVYFMHRNYPSRFMQRLNAISYGAHIQNFMTKDLIIDTSPNSTQVFALLAQRHCPYTFAYYFNV